MLSPSGVLPERPSKPHSPPRLAHLPAWLSARPWPAALLAALLVLSCLPVGPVSALARYLLLTYIPGLAVMALMGTARTSIVELCLLPPLFGLLPTCALALALSSLGVPIHLLAGATVAAFLPVVAVTLPRQRLAWTGAADLLAVLAVSLPLVIGPLAANNFEARAWDAPLHAAITTRVIQGELPPLSPLVAGQSVHYYWLYHLHTGLVSLLTGLPIYRTFALVNIHAFLLFCLAGMRLSSRFGADLGARLLALGLLVSGLNPFGWMVFAWQARTQPDPWPALVVPFQMTEGYAPQLSNLVHQFLDGNPFPVFFAFGLLWLDSLLSWIDGSRSVRAFLCGVLLLGTALHVHLFAGALLVGASSVACLADCAIQRRQPAVWARLGGVLAMIAGSLLVALPYVHQVMQENVATPLSLDFSPHRILLQGLYALACLGATALVALPCRWRAWTRTSPAARLLTLHATALVFVYLVLHTPGGTEYKALYLAGQVIAPLGALAWQARSARTRAAAVAALVWFAPTNLLMSAAFAFRPPPHHRTEAGVQLHEWLHANTPTNAILVAPPPPSARGRTTAQRLEDDAHAFDIPIYARPLSWSANTATRRFLSARRFWTRSYLENRCVPGSGPISADSAHPCTWLTRRRSPSDSRRRTTAWSSPTASSACSSLIWPEGETQQEFRRRSPAVVPRSGKLTKPSRRGQNTHESRRYWRAAQAATAALIRSQVA